MRGATARIPETKINCSISIHAPHAGRDRLLTAKTKSAAISIHAPHAGRDGTSAIGLPSYGHFNPRAPCGARPVQQAPPAARYNRFQSTRPMRGATVTRVVTLVTIVISIHAPHAGRDIWREPPWSPARYFNPRAPCGARQPRRRSEGPVRYFNPRAPCGARHWIKGGVSGE